LYCPFSHIGAITSQSGVAGCRKRGKFRLTADESRPTLPAYEKQDSSMSVTAAAIGGGLEGKPRQSGIAQTVLVECRPHGRIVGYPDRLPWVKLPRTVFASITHINNFRHTVRLNAFEG